MLPSNSEFQVTVASYIFKTRKLFTSEMEFILQLSSAEHTLKQLKHRSRLLQYKTLAFMKL